MSAEYRKFEREDRTQKPKSDRRKLVSLRLEEKRFLLSDNPDLIELIRNIKNATKEMKLRHPEIVSFALFGSLSKGYATNESDVDMYVFIEEERWKNAAGSQVTYLQRRDLDNEYPFVIADELRDKLNLSEKQLKRVGLEVLNKNKLYDRCIANGTEYYWPLFLLNTSLEIEEYRKIILDALDELEKRHRGDGEYQWRMTLNELFSFENAGLDADLLEKRKNLYPQTLALARQFFLSGSQPERAEVPAAIG